MEREGGKGIMKKKKYNSEKRKKGKREGQGNKEKISQ